MELAEKNGEGKRLYTHDGKVDSQAIYVNLHDINPSVFTTRCTFSHLSDFAAAICTLDPEDGFGEKVVRGRGESTLYYSATTSKERLSDLAIDNEPTSEDSLMHELMRQGKHNITAAVDFGDGVVMIMPLFRVAPIVIGIEFLHGRLRRDCENMGLKAACVGFEIEFLKELFRACFPGATGHDGYIKLAKAFFAKFRRTIFELSSNPEPEERRELVRFYNPITKKPFVLEESKCYYKMILYLLTHVSSNPLAQSLTIAGGKLTEMLAQVCPSLLKMEGGKPRIRNIYDAKLFIDKSAFILNAMGRRGFCESMLAVTERSIYFRLPEGGFGVEIFYKKSGRRLDVPLYQSNFSDAEVIGECPF